MVFGKSKIEFKVGIFVFLSLIILVIFVLSIGSFRTLTSGYHVYFIFNFVNGLKTGAPVRFAGVDVGEVKEIKFIPNPEGGNPRVKINCWITKEIKIPADSTVWVNTLGLLGEKYVEIMPGREVDNYIIQKQSLVGVDPLPMHEMLRLADSIGKNVNDTLEMVRQGQGTVGKLITDDTIYKDLEALTEDLKQHPWKLLWKGKEKQ